MTIDTNTIVRNKGGRFVGRIEGKTFVKDVYGNKHMLRKPAAWAIDCDIFDRVVKPLCYSIKIVDRDSGHTYIVGTATFIKNRQRLNRKFGDQYYLELIHWKVT